MFSAHIVVFFWTTQIQLTRSLEVSEQVKARGDVHHESGGNRKQTGGSQLEGASVVVKRGRGRPRKVCRLKEYNTFMLLQ